jgi:hypothetical protein
LTAVSWEGKSPRKGPQSGLEGRHLLAFCVVHVQAQHSVSDAAEHRAKTAPCVRTRLTALRAYPHRATTTGAHAQSALFGTAGADAHHRRGVHARRGARGRVVAAAIDAKRRSLAMAASAPAAALCWISFGPIRSYGHPTAAATPRLPASDDHSPARTAPARHGL